VDAVLETDRADRRPPPAPTATGDAAQVLSAHWPMITRIARAHERDGDRRKDLLQEIALAMLRALPAFRGETTLRVFVARVAENRCLSHAAREARSPLDGEPDAALPALGPGPEERTAQDQRVARLLGAIDRLPLALREAAVLALEGFEPREVGEVLGITANTAAQRMKRAREALRSALEEGP
jgi:RNA polymerase sigma factor (sigma-70 family)